MNRATRWISVDGNEMMRKSMQSFLKFLGDFNVDYISYHSEKDDGKLFIKLSLTNEIVQDKNHEFWKGIGEWIYYNPVNMLKNPPKVSDYNIIEDMSIDPYDIDKWRNS